MRTVIYDVPGMMSVEQAARNMVKLVKQEAKLTPNVDVQVVGEHNGIEFGAQVGTTVKELVDYWHEKRHERAIRDERLRPVSDAIRYLLGTLGPEDCQLVVKEIAEDWKPGPHSLLKEGK
jgi:hypothetical protein